MQCRTEIPKCNFMARSMSDHWFGNGDMQLTRYAIHKTDAIKDRREQIWQRPFILTRLKLMTGNSQC
jgi:hypothetical protein